MTSKATLESRAARSPGLPPGTLDLAARYVEEADAWLRALTGAALGTDRAWVERQLWLPLEVESDWPRPKAPLPVGERNSWGNCSVLRHQRIAGGALVACTRFRFFA